MLMLFSDAHSLDLYSVNPGPDVPLTQSYVRANRPIGPGCCECGNDSTLAPLSDLADNLRELHFYLAVKVSRVPGMHSSRFQLFKVLSSLKVNV